MFNHFLSLLIWIPIAGAVPVLLAGSARPMLARVLAMLVTVLTFVVSLGLLTRYDPSGAVMQLQESHAWIATWGVHYSLAVDGISVALILMTIAGLPSNAGPILIRSMMADVADEVRLATGVDRLSLLLSLLSSIGKIGPALMTGLVALPYLDAWWHAGREKRHVG